MANEPANTLIQTKYADQMAADLAANKAEQTKLTTRLAQLQMEEEWFTATLESMPRVGAEPLSAQVLAEPVSPAPPVGDAAEEAAVPQPRAGKNTDSTAAVEKAAAAPVRKAQATQKTAPRKKAAGAKETAKAAGPTLGQLLSDLLSLQPGEPQKVSEIRTELEKAHPERAKSDPVVRSALESLAKKGVLEKNTQQGTVFYTWPVPEKAPAAVAEVTAQENAEAVAAGA